MSPFLFSCQFMSVNLLIYSYLVIFPLALRKISFYGEDFLCLCSRLVFYKNEAEGIFSLCLVFLPFIKR
ncbi:hypothetical protein GT3570_08185 [Geobacillus thermoleovorans]|nr:hypothetical protein GT3570_08185 [Geobacillus thermoleovorans]